MITGELDENRPYITVPIRWAGRVQEIPVLIDTGFDGDIRISRKEAEDLKLIFDHSQRFEFADGSKKDVPGSIGYSECNGVINSVNIAILDGQAMIGMGFLEKFSAILTINLKQKSVTIS